MKLLKYSQLLSENVQQAKTLLTKLDIPFTDPDYQKIRKMLTGHDGYTYWFCKLRFVDRIPITELQDVWTSIKENENLVQMFSKPVVQLENLEKFWDELEKAKMKHGAKTVLDQFPHTQKILMDLKDENDLILLHNLSQSKSLPALIKKISSFKDKKSLIEAANRLLNHKASASFDVMVDKIKKTGATIKVADPDEDIIICQVNFKQITELGGDTSWCIVRSSGTFDSYAKGGFQWVIFLLDNTDKMSKIGLTTAFDYITAHDKYDGYISKDKIVNLLSSRGVDFKDLLITVKTLYEMPNWNDIAVGVLIDRNIPKEVIIERKKIFRISYGHRVGSSKRDLEYFTLSEIEKFNLIDRSELDLHQLHKLSKEFIIDKKCLSRLTYKASLSQVMQLGFSKEEIIQHKLFNECIIDTSGITIFNKEELIKYGVINIARNLPLQNLIAIGFTKDEVLKKYSESLDLRTKSILDMFKDMKKPKILEKLRSMWSDDWKKLGADGRVSEIGNVRGNLMIQIFFLFDIGPSDVSLLPNSVSKRALFDYIKQDSEAAAYQDIVFLKGLYKLGYKISEEKGIQKIHHYSSHGSKLQSTDVEFSGVEAFVKIVGLEGYRYSYSKLLSFYDTMKSVDLEGSKLIYQFILNKIDKIIEKKPIDRTKTGKYYSSQSYDGMEYNAINIELDYFYLTKLKDDINPKHPEVWKKIYDIAREGMMVKPNEFRTSNESRSGSYLYPNADNTIRFIEFFHMKKEDLDKRFETFDKLLGWIDAIFETRYNEEADRVLKFFIDLGFKFSNDELFKIVQGIYKEKDTISYWKYLISKNLAVDDSYKKILNKLNEYNKSESESWINSLIEFFSKNGGVLYMDDLNKKIESIKKREDFFTIRNQLDITFQSSSGYYDKKLTLQEWYDKYFESYINSQSYTPRHYSNKGSKDLKVLILLAKIGKLEDADKVGYDFNLNYETFDDVLIHTLSKIICGSGRLSKDCREKLKFSEDDRKKLYDWTIQRVDETKMNNRRYLQVCYYIYDRPKFEKYLEDVKLLKNNISYWTSNRAGEEIQKTYTNRLSSLRYILSYLAQKEYVGTTSEDDYKEFKRIVMTIFNHKMTKGEFVKFIDTLSYIAIDNYTEGYLREKHDKYKTFVKSFIESLNEKANEKLKKVVKESRIFSWENFKSFHN